MCGFLAIIQRDRPVERARALRALRTIGHRGPDHEALEIFAAEGAAGPVSVGLGHVRLAIIDLDRRANQPFHGAASRLVYNGEIYNFRALREDLGGGGFSTDSDTEVLDRLLATGPAEGLQKINGFFAFVRHDAARGVVTAARDRLGKKPLFYRAEPGLIVLASEAKAIHAYAGRAGRLKREAVASFLRHGWLIPEGGGATHLDGVNEVPPGGLVTLDLKSGALTVSRWIAAEPKFDAPEPAQLPGLLEDAVRRRLVSDRKIGLLLSGGIDSSLILALLKKIGRAEDVTAYIGEAGKSEDGAYALAAARAAGVEARVVNIDYGGGALDKFLAVCRHQEKPFPLIGNVLGLPQMYERLAADDVRVVIDGTGGDEIFGGYYARYLTFARREAEAAGDAPWLADFAGMATSATDLSAQELGFLRGETMAAASSDPLADFQGSFTAALRRDTLNGRLQEWLWQNDRNAMAFGLENRSPLLDPRLIAWLGTGYRAKFEGGLNKRELRAVLAGLAPLPTAKRAEKQGFRWVFSRFLKEHRERLISMIAESELVGVLIDRERFVDALEQEPELIYGDLAQRAVSLTGVELAL